MANVTHGTDTNGMFFFYNFHELQVKCVRHAPIESSVCVDGACYALDFVHCRKKKISV